MRLSPWVKPLTFGAWALAFLSGLWAEGLGSAGMIHLLSPPVLGTLAWNILMYALLALGALWSWRRRPDLAVSASVHLDRRLQTAWIKRALHGAAALFTLGLMVSMYIRGVLMNYSAAWSSTFLSAEHVHAMLYPVLGLAATWLGDGFPRIEHLANLRFMGTGPLPAGVGEGAARWIHWYAFTLALWVVLPRLLMLAWQHVKARQWHHQWQHQAQQQLLLDADLAKYQVPLSFEQQQPQAAASAYAPERCGRLFTYNMPTGVNASPKSIDLTPWVAALDSALSRELFHLWHEKLRIVSLISCNDQTLGDDVAWLDSLQNPLWTVKSNASSALVKTAAVLFSIAQTPEPQTHGRFLQLLKTQAKSVNPAWTGASDQTSVGANSAPVQWPQDWLIVLDETPFHQRFQGVVLQQRLQARRRAWMQMLMQACPELETVVGLNLNPQPLESEGVL